MSFSDDEFGSVYDDDLLHAATQAERPPSPTYPETDGFRSPKRRRLDNLSNAKRSGTLTSKSSVPDCNDPITLSTRNGAAGVSNAPREKPMDGINGTQRKLWQKPKKAPRAIIGRALQETQSRATPSSNGASSGHSGLDDREHHVTSDHGGPTDSQLHNAIEVSSQGGDGMNWDFQARGFRPMASQGNLRQATLLGGPARDATAKPTGQTKRPHNWPLANKNEAPTHHELDDDALRTWIYPTNLGAIRTYQYNIVARGLYHNLLVALPTGLGKTFIAATIMLNWLRWTRSAQIVFVAPTKPLVSQQVDACFNIAGIPRSATTMLTGNTAPGIRAEEWNAKRVFFMTPQTIVNDLKTGICDPKRVVLMVVDEAHRATGSYAYVEAVRFLRRFNESFRVLALTATPGSTVEGVQEVIDGLGIRTEESLDIRYYVHPRQIDTIIFEYSDEMIMLMDLYSIALQPLVNKLASMNAYWGRDPMTLTPYGMNQARMKWMNSEVGRKANMGIKGMLNTIFTILAKLAHPIDLLKFHGIAPFYHSLESFRTDQESGNSKYRKQVFEDESFRKMTGLVAGWIRNNDFVGHPKLEYVQSVVLNHFLDASEGRAYPEISPAHTRIMIFAHFRDSAEEIVRVLKRNDPMVRPHVFVGQAAAKGSEGMGQKQQLEIISKFKSGVFNTLVATSIGEEGLDIGEVDLIICYDASASPIRMLQRMGRTGRKRAGNIVVTLMKGKEENSFNQAKDNYQKMQLMIAEGSRFTYHDNLAPRIVPRGVEPVVDKRVIEIPVENSQGDLPEPKKRARAPKRPPKKFHMPDNVQTGFTKASRIGDPRENDESDDEETLQQRAKRRKPRTPSPEPDPLPPLDKVLLSDSQMKELDRVYLQVAGDGLVLIEAPRLETYPALQRQLRGTGVVGHGIVTKRVIRTLNSMHQHEHALDEFESQLHPADKAVVDSHLAARGRWKPRRLLSKARSASPQHAASLSQRRQNGDATPVSESMSKDDYDPDDDNDEDLRDFIDDDPIAKQKSTSPLATPLPTERREMPFFQPTASSYLLSQESTELPEIESLLGKAAVSPSPRIGTSTQSGRGGRRMVVDSDDDG